MEVVAHPSPVTRCGPMTLLRNALLVAAVVLAGCSDTTRLAMGEVNSIIVVADDSLWAQVSDTMLTALQPRIFAVRDEPTFQLTHTAPTSEHWGGSVRSWPLADRTTRGSRLRWTRPTRR